MLKKIYIGKYWSSYVQWRNLLLLTPYSVEKIVGKTSFFYCVTNAVALVYRRNVPMAEKRVVFLKQKSENM